MADLIATPIPEATTVAPVPVSIPAPVATPAPVTETVVAPVATPAPVPVATAPEPVVTPIETPQAPIAGATTLLAEAPVAPALVTPEPVQVQDTNTAGGQSAEPAPPPTYEPFKLPEDAPLDAARISEFTDLLSELEVSGKADHSQVQTFGQKAIDFHVNEVRSALENHTKLMVDAFENQKLGWKDEVSKDPDIGGPRLQATLESAKTFIRTHGGTPEQQAEFLSLMDSSGLGNHKAVIRLFANAMATMSEGSPLATVKPVPQIKSRTQTMYGRG